MCKHLATIIHNFIEGRRRTKGSALSIVIESYLKLRLNEDISMLNNNLGHLFTTAMDFFRLWFTHNHKSHKGPYITHPHMWDIVKNWIKEKGKS
jgi:hypothetical protein